MTGTILTEIILKLKTRNLSMWDSMPATRNNNFLVKEGNDC